MSLPLLLFHNQGRGQPIGGRESYIQKVLGIETSDLIAYWPTIETSGTIADNAEGTAARDATYNSDVSGWPIAPGIGDGNTCPTFDGLNDEIAIYTASFRDAFSGAAGTACIWFKVSAAGIWIDGNWHYSFYLWADPNNFVRIVKKNTNNTLQYVYKAGGTAETIEKGSVSATGWLHLAITWDKSANAAKAYYNGSQEGSTQTIAGTWAGNLAAGNTFLGASATGTNLFDGYLPHMAVWTTALSASQIANLAVV